LCQENLVQWNQRLDELEGTRIVIVSIGLPEKAKYLAEHLGLGTNADQLLFVDPENGLYDALQLNRGVDRTFFNINTPYSMVDRFTKKDGMKQLTGVLGKWNKGEL